MSNWDSQLTILTSAVKCRGAMYVRDGTPMAGATQVKITPAEILKIISGFANLPLIRQTGATVEGVKYMTLQAQSPLIVLKSGAKGAVFGVSNKAVTACLFDESSTTTARAMAAVTNYLNYLKPIGF